LLLSTVFNAGLLKVTNRTEVALLIPPAVMAVWRAKKEEAGARPVMEDELIQSEDSDPVTPTLKRREV
jgi:hypothetical protein